MPSDGFRRAFATMAERPGRELDLGRACLLVAREQYPDLDVEAYLGKLAGLGSQLASRLAGRDPAESAGLLAQYLCDELGFRANTEDYYDPRNSFLNEVLDRRTGIPITLSAVFVEVGRRAGLSVDGVGLPGHFVVRVGGDHGVLLDPYHCGVPLSPEDCQRRLDRVFVGRVQLEPRMLEAWDNRSILARVLRNLRVIYAKAFDWPRALWVADLMVRLRPDAPEELRERGLLYAAADCYGLAASDLERYLVMVPRAADAQELWARLAHLRERALRLN